LTLSAALEVEATNATQQLGRCLAQMNMERYTQSHEDKMHQTNKPKPPDSMRDAVLTVSPKRQ
jgi:hypothetical protein